MTWLLEGLDKNPCDGLAVSEAGRNKKPLAMAWLLVRLDETRTPCDGLAVSEAGRNKIPLAMAWLLEGLDETRKPLR